MAQYLQLDGVNMWYDRRGAGDPVVLLHGGLTDSRDFGDNLAGLVDRFQLFLPERRGHGHTADVPGPLTTQVMAEDTAAFLERVVGRPAALVGYSAGATVALRTALLRPQLVDTLVLISGTFHRDGMIMLPSADGPLPPQLVAAYAQVSPDGVEHLPVVVEKIARAAAQEPGLTVTDLGRVSCRALVMTGDDDIVALEHTVALYRGLPRAELVVVPGTSHLLLHEKAQLCTRLVGDFLAGAEPRTMMPIRRAATHAGRGSGV